MKLVLRAVFLLLTVVVVVAGAMAYSVARRGLSARVPPSAVEERLALAMRQLATPAVARSRSNPLKADPAVVDEALRHFAEQCAVCHANDGSGSAMGKSFYPPAPDMRAARTQRLTDGELFSIIENGIRLTGMPAWGDGTPASEASTWALVHFIRRLPSLPADDIARMEALNPRSPADLREEETIRRFLAGEDVPADPPSSHKNSHD